MARAVPGWLHSLLRGCGVTLLYTAGGIAGLQAAILVSTVSAAWAPAGVSLWAFFRYGPRIAPFLLAGSFLVAVSTGASVGSTVGVACCSVLACLLGAQLLRRVGFRRELDRSRDVLWLAGASVVTAAIASATGLPLLVVLGTVAASELPRLSWVWFIGDLMGLVVAAPALFTIGPAIRRRDFAGRWPELLAMVGALLALSLVVFLGSNPWLPEQALYSRAFLLLPLAVWAAIRFGPAGAAGMSLALSALAVAATASGRGPFVDQILVEGVIVLQLFLAVVIGTALVLAASTAERQAAERQLVLVERLAAVGSLAAGVAHEINNPLAFVITNLELLERELVRADQRLVALIRDARFGAERVRLIVQDLKVLSRDNAAQREPVSLDRVVESALRIAGRDLGQRARLILELGDPPPVLGNQARLGQLVLNLLLNAAQAFPPDFRGEARIRVRTGVAPDGRVLLEVRDNGCGIAPEHLQKIFVPFFTTKPAGEGTGLGLSICQGIATAHGGEITVESRQGAGSSFRVLLPPHEAEERAPEATPVVPLPSPAQEERRRVLIVDDEARLAHSMRLLLEPEHEAVVCTSGEEALALLRKDAAFDLILCDLHMPGLSGIDLHREIAAANPPLAERMIFLSGGAITDEARAFVATASRRVLDKPIRPERLLEIVRTTRAA